MPCPNRAKSASPPGSASSKARATTTARSAWRSLKSPTTGPAFLPRCATGYSTRFCPPAHKEHMQSINRRRVVVTGIGVVSPVGIGLEPFWKNIVAGVSGVDRSPVLTRSECPWKIAGEVKDFRSEEWLGRKDAKRMDRFAQFALVASYLALQDSKLNLDNEDRHRIGVSMGTAYA